MRCWFAILACLVVPVALSKPAQSQEQPAAEPAQVETINLSVAPAAEPRPALKYRLMPAPHERQPGNAAIFYYRALLAIKSLPQDHWKEFDEKSAAWLAGPIEKIPKEE